MFPVSLFLNKYVLGAIALVAILGGVYYAGWHSRDREFTAYRQQEAADAATKTALVDRINEVSAQKDKEAQVVIKTRTQTIVQHEKEYIDRPIYHNVCLDSDGLRDANSALSPPATPTSGTPAKVPGSDPAK